MESIARRVSLETLHDVLNGVLHIGPISFRGSAVGGLELVFSNPGVSVLFPGSQGDVLSIRGIAAELSVIGEVAIRVIRGRDAAYLAMWRDGGFTISPTGSANPLLGISTGQSTVSAGPLARDQILLLIGDLIVYHVDPVAPGSDTMVDGTGNQLIDGSGNRMVP